MWIEKFSNFSYLLQKTDKKKRGDLRTIIFVFLQKVFDIFVVLNSKIYYR